MALTDAQMVDVRRFAGYSVAGTSITITDDQDTVYLRFGTNQMSLHRRLTTLSPNEETVLTGTFLANLYILETAIPAVSGNLDTDEASVWVHNKNELRDRIQLFNRWRKSMCEYLGLAPAFSSGGMVIERG